MKVAITGAGGRLGYFVRETLAAAGHAVRPMDRTLHGDLSQDDFRPFLEGCDGLIHAAFAHVPGKYRGGEGDDPLGFWQLNFNGTLRLLEQAREMGVRKVVLFSSRAVYAADQVGFFEEDVEPKPDTHYGVLKRATELLATLYTNAQMQVTVLRPTGIYGGPTELNKWRPLIDGCLRGQFPAENREATEVHGKTVAGAAAMVLDDEAGLMAGQVLNLSEVRVTTADLIKMAGFQTPPLPQAKPMRGPELSSKMLKDLGLELRGMRDLELYLLNLRSAMQA